MDKGKLTVTGKEFAKRSRTAIHDRLVDEIIRALSKTGLCRVWPQPTGVAYRDGLPPIRYGILGGADISGILIGGRRLEIEVKTGQAVQQDNQKAFESMIKMFGGIYFVARSVDEAVAFIKSVAANCKS